MASLGKWALGCNCRGKPLNKKERVERRRE
jgi:hypothetical protein